MKRTNFTVASGKIQQGFTLMELMVVMAIIAILAAIGYPSYTQHTITARRAAAESFMQNVATRQEQIMLDMRSYVAVVANADFLNAPTATPPGINMLVPADVSAFYDIAVSTPTSSSYTITATPKNGQITDTKCKILGLDQTGQKTVTGTHAVSGCW